MTRPHGIGNQMMKAGMDADPWLVIPRRAPAARLRLFCFAYAGAGASIFRTWPGGLPHSMELCAVQLPGRETRLREAPFTRMSRLVEALARALAPCMNLPFALFGHRMRS